MIWIGIVGMFFSPFVGAMNPEKPMLQTLAALTFVGSLALIFYDFPEEYAKDQRHGSGISTLWIGDRP